MMSATNSRSMNTILRMTKRFLAYEKLRIAKIIIAEWHRSGINQKYDLLIDFLMLYPDLSNTLDNGFVSNTINTALDSIVLLQSTSCDHDLFTIHAFRDALLKEFYDGLHDFERNNDHGHSFPVLEECKLHLQKSATEKMNSPEIGIISFTTTNILEHSCIDNAFEAVDKL